MKRTIQLLAVFAVALMLPVLAVAQDAVEEHAYVGAAKCKKCHLKQYKSWQETKMAQAYESLKPGVDVEAKESVGLDPEKDYTQDADCVSCHVTGYEKEGGFVDVESTEALAGVGCESCHGAGGTYIQDEYMSLKNKQYVKAEVVAVGLVDTVGAEQCTDCHNENSPFAEEGFVFNYDEVKDEGTHEHFPLKYEH